MLMSLVVCDGAININLLKDSVQWHTCNPKIIFKKVCLFYWQYICSFWKSGFSTIRCYSNGCQLRFIVSISISILAWSITQSKMCTWKTEITSCGRQLDISIEVYRLRIVFKHLLLTFLRTRDISQWTWNKIYPRVWFIGFILRYDNRKCH